MVVKSKADAVCSKAMPKSSPAYSVRALGLVSFPQGRVRFPAAVEQTLRWVARLDLTLTRYHRDNWFARHCSLIILIGERV